MLARIVLCTLTGLPVNLNISVNELLTACICRNSSKCLSGLPTVLSKRTVYDFIRKPGVAKTVLSQKTSKYLNRDFKSYIQGKYPTFTNLLECLLHSLALSNTTDNFYGSWKTFQNLDAKMASTHGLAENVLNYRIHSRKLVEFNYFFI